MDIEKVQRTWEEFFNINYKEKILERIIKGKDHIVLDFKILSMFDPLMADELLDNPEESFRLARDAIAYFFEKEGKKGTLEPRFINLPKSVEIRIRDLRSTHINKFMSIGGLIQQTSDVRPIIITSVYECPSCGNNIKMIQIRKIIPPSRCNSCGRGGRFKMLQESSEKMDCQRLVLEEDPEFLEGGEQPVKINVIVLKDMTETNLNIRNTPGTKVQVSGIIREIPKFKGNTELTERDLAIEANFIASREESFIDLNISQEDKEKILQLSKQKDLIDKFIASYSPDIEGYTEIKEAIILQLFGGVNKKEHLRRGDFHILLVGDPGIAKSKLLRYATKIAPKARYTSGKGTKGVGLTAAAVRDEFTGGWTLVAGAAALANKGLLIIDELDKIPKEEREALHEPLEEQIIPISKATIQATLKAELAALCAANPKLGRFSSYETLPSQIDLPPALINRFDLIFPIQDLPDEKRDSMVVAKILKVHKLSKDIKPEIDAKFLRKYIAYAKQNITPLLTDTTDEKIRQYYLAIRNSNKKADGTPGPIPITARQLEAIIRLAEASARAHLSKIVRPEDVDRAVRLLTYCLERTALDPETGKLDVDRITIQTTSSQRDRIYIVKDIIRELCEQDPNHLASIDDIERIANEQHKVPSDKTYEAIQKLSTAGDIYMPKPNKYALLQ